MLTGARKDQYDYLVTLRRQRLITKEVFESEKAKLYRKEQGLEKAAETREKKREAAEAKKEAEREKKRAEARAAAKVRAAEKAKAKRQQQGRKKLNILVDHKFSGASETLLSDIYDAVRGRGHVRMIVKNSGTIRLDRILNPVEKGTGYAVWRTQLLEGGSEGDTIFETGDHIYIMMPTSMKAKRISQLFADGTDHCLFKPLTEYLSDRMLDAKSKTTVDRLKYRLKKTLENWEPYKIGILRDVELEDGTVVKRVSHGVPHEDMARIAKDAGVKIKLIDWAGNKIDEWNTHSPYHLTFTNTRRNHVDPGRVVMEREATIVTREEMLKAMESPEFKMFQGNALDVPQRLITLDKTLALENPDKEPFERMDELINKRKYTFNAGKNADVAAFMKDATVVTGAPVKLGEGPATGHRDMPRAYSQFKKCEYYQGFLGVIHQWRCGPFDRAFIEKHVGLYRAQIKAAPSLLARLGVEGTVTLPSPELLFFMDCGVEMTIDAGVWGSTFDFEFPEEMLEDKRYARWCGRLDSAKPYRYYSFTADPQWAAYMKDRFGDDAQYYGDICTVKKKLDNHVTHRHIFAFITAYMRIQMLKAMMAFKEEQLVSVVMDGIYFTGEAPAEVDWFVEKPVKQHDYFVEHWYPQSHAEIDWTPVKYAESTLLTGQGGSGKTHGVCTDKGYNHILFVAPEHVIGEDAHEKYGVAYVTTHKLLGMGCQPFKETDYYPSVLFCDEMTKWDVLAINKLQEMYSDSLIIMAGDLKASGQWYQCRFFSGDGALWKPTLPVVEIKGDRRSVAGDPLIEYKMMVRNKMDQVFEKYEGNDRVIRDLMSEWVAATQPLTSWDEAVAAFKPEDTWIAGTHATNEKLIAAGVVSGWWKKGGGISKTEQNTAQGWSKRGSYTIHAYQGKTIYEGKIYISVHDMFDYAMFYTAVSRAVRMDQLVFVAAPSV